MQGPGDWESRFFAAPAEGPIAAGGRNLHFLYSMSLLRFPNILLITNFNCPSI
jgi:hypothetical protein